MRLFNPDCYIIVTTNDERLDLSTVSEKTGRRLDLSFNVFATKDSQPNEGECVIYNLTETTRNKITEGSKVELFAGYDGIYSLVAIGDIDQVQNRKPSTDWVTTIKWGDGKDPYQQVNFTKSYKEGSSVKDVLNDVASSFGLAVKGAIEGLTNNLDGGLSVDGRAKDVLNKITNDYGLEWSIQDNEVVVVRKDQPIDDEVILVTQETGLLEFPQVSEKGTDFISQLNPRLRPNKLVDIQSSNFVRVKTNSYERPPNDSNGINIVETVRFTGDNFGGPFSSQVKCESYEPV